MTPYVQEFIEENIDLIELKKYKEVFSLWYDEADANIADYDELFWGEFIEALEIVDPDVLLKTTQIRINQMSKVINSIFVNQLPELHNGLYLSHFVVLDILLPTHLGLETKTLTNLMDKEAKRLNLRKVPDGYAV